MPSMPSIVICLEAPQKNYGVDRIHSVTSYDTNGKKIREYPELAYERDFFSSDNGNTRLEIVEYVASKLKVSKDIIKFWDEN